MKILNHPEHSVEDMLKISAYYEANKKDIKKQKMAKSCYRYINEYIEEKLKGKAELQPKEGLFYKYTKYHQNINFINASYEERTEFVEWIKMFTINKVKLTGRNNKQFCLHSGRNLHITYK